MRRKPLVKLKLMSRSYNAITLLLLVRFSLTLYFFTKFVNLGCFSGCPDLSFSAISNFQIWRKRALMKAHDLLTLKLHLNLKLVKNFWRYRSLSMSKLRFFWNFPYKKFCFRLTQGCLPINVHSNES